MIGKTVSHYRIQEELGRGGMGVVYRAEDTRLQRTVALKFLPPSMTSDPGARERFVNEARAASALDHPNICTIHEIDETAGGQTFIVMAYYEGETLKEKIGRGALEIGDALDIAYQAAEGLREAHAKEIVHRDIKPANIAVLPDGLVKIMDFGLAKLRGQTILTKEVTTLGTVSYMAPEQARGENVDQRADIWSLGVVLYETLTGHRPFRGDYEQAVIYSILNEDPVPPSSIRSEIPGAVESIIQKALQKDPAKRFQSMREFRGALIGCGIPFRSAPHRAGAGAARLDVLRRPAVAIPVLIVILLCALLAIRYLRGANELRRVQREIIPRIMELVEQERYYDAYVLADGVRDIASGDALYERLRGDMTDRVTVLTTPPGADVSILKYEEPDGDWIAIGRTPLDGAAVPRGFHRWRIEKKNFTPVEIARSSGPDTLSFVLDEIGTIPDGMIKVPGGKRSSYVAGYGFFHTADLPDFFMDHFEVTNRRYQAFVDSGGYRRPELWRHQFMHEGRTLSFEEAMTLLVDKTGRPGPATWELGAFQEGSGDLPVTGVSWYEADACARFAGKRLPSIHHWIYAASVRESEHIIPLSNCGSDGLAAVGSRAGMSYDGVCDMAGNAAEWCHTAYEGDRYIMGGCWSDPHYTFNFPDRRPPFDRSPCNGFRCVQFLPGHGEPEGVYREDVYAPLARDYSKERAVPDEIFAAYRSIYAYEKTALDPRIELVDDAPEHWTIEKISYNAAYGKERITAYLFLPRGAQRPYQVAVLFPGSYALEMRSSGNGRDLNTFDFVDFVVRSGRAALCPVYKSMYERGDGFSPYDPDATVSDFQTHMLMWYKDLARSVDYLETRDDIDIDRLAYFGSSFGAFLSPQYLAQDGRYTAAVLRFCGLPTWAMPPAFDPINFAPRITIPVLMINGRYDYIFPHETSQVPMYEMLGTPPANKRHVIFETAHSISGYRNKMIRETLDWLDRYLGPARRHR